MTPVQKDPKQLDLKAPMSWAHKKKHENQNWQVTEKLCDILPQPSCPARAILSPADKNSPGESFRGLSLT